MFVRENEAKRKGKAMDANKMARKVTKFLNSFEIQPECKCPDVLRREIADLHRMLEFYGAERFSILVGARAANMLSAGIVTGDVSMELGHLYAQVLNLFD